MAWKRIDIVKWESDAFQQARREYGIRGIPYIRVYGKRGDFLGEVKGSKLEAIQELAKKGM